MAKSDTTTPGTPVIVDQAPDAFPLPLEEFCQRLSVNDSRVELIGGFYAAEKRSGNLKDTEAAYSARFAAFVSPPA